MSQFVLRLINKLYKKIIIIYKKRKGGLNLGKITKGIPTILFLVDVLAFNGKHLIKFGLFVGNIISKCLSNAIIGV